MTYSLKFDKSKHSATGKTVYRLALMGDVQREANHVERMLCSGGGDTPRDAARWLVHNLEKMVEEGEQLLVDAGYLTEAELSELLADVDEKAAKESIP